MKWPMRIGREEMPFVPSGIPDRISQTLFGKHGEEKRWDALDRIAMPGQSEWSYRLLLWMLAADSAEIRERAWEILDHTQLDLDLLIHELSCPMWQVRIGVIRLIAKYGRLDTIRLLITGIEDYHQNVVDETKQSLYRLIEIAKERKTNGDLSQEEILDALTVLVQPLYSSKRSQRFQAIQFLFKVIPLDEALFWEIYLRFDIPQYSALHDEFIRFQKEGSLEVLYRGFLQKNALVLDRLNTFVVMAIRNSGENINYHLNAFRSLTRDDFVQLASVLQRFRILAEYQGCIKNIASQERIVLFDLLEAVGAEQNLSFLLRCMQLDDMKIRIRILKILGDSPNLGLRNEVFEFLTESDEQVLLATLRYLQKKGDLGVLERISPLLRSKKRKVKQGVMTTMFKIMKDNFLRKFDQIPSAKRKKIVESLLKMEPNFFQEISFLSQSLEEDDRIKYVRILESEKWPIALKEYQRLAKDPSPKVRASAIQGFERLEDMDLRFQLLQPFFDDPDPRVRANAIDLLPNQSPEDSSMIERVRWALHSDHHREKANALTKLLNWGYSEYEASLIEMMDSEDELTKTSALWVLGMVHLPKLLPRLREAANDPRAHVRKMAVRGIGIKGLDEDVRALMPFLQDPDRGVRVAARTALRNRLNLSFEIA